MITLVVKEGYYPQVRQVKTFQTGVAGKLIIKYPLILSGGALQYKPKARTIFISVPVLTFHVSCIYLCAVREGELEWRTRWPPRSREEA